MRRTGILARMWHAAVFMRSVSTVVIMALGLWVVRPVLVQAQVPPGPEAAHHEGHEPWRPAPPPAEELQLSQKLEAMAEKLTTLEREMASDPGVGLESLEPLAETIADLDRAVRRNFGRVAEHLERHDSAPEIRQRHQQALASYQAHMARLRDNLAALSSKSAPADRAQAVRAALDHLRAKPLARRHQPVDPNALPAGRARAQEREPMLAVEDFQKLLAGAAETTPEGGELLAKAMATKSLLPPQPEDLEQTEEVQITPEITALASALGGEALAIFAWVHDNIEFVPTYGSIQGSRMTLEARRGNAFDIAALLIALLRASGIPSRFAVGTVQLPAATIQNWLGGVPTPQVAQQLLGQGGIPNVGLLEGGEITAIRLEHVWAEAWLDFVPGRGRGAGDSERDTWVPVDASFKQHVFDPGTGVIQAVPFDFAGVTDALLADADVDEALGRIVGVEPNIVIDAFFEHQQASQEFFLDNGFENSPEAIIGSKTIIANSTTVLPASLPYRVVVRGGAMASLPASLRHEVTLIGYNSVFDRTLGNVAFSHSISLPELNSRRLGLTYEPATEADAEILQSSIDDDVPTLPLYLINVRPLVTLDGDTVATGSPVGMGSFQFVDVVLKDPDGSATIDYEVLAGDENVFSINGNGITESVVQARFDLVPADTAAETLHQIALHYWMEVDYFDQLAASSLEVFPLRRPSLGLYGSPLDVGFLFGSPISGVYQSRFMDVKRSFIGAAAETSEQTRAFVRMSGFQGSFFEGSVFDQLSGKPLGRGISAVQLLFDATLAGIPVYEITSDNVAAVLPLLSLPSAVEADIANSVNAGKVVLAPETQITKDTYTGVGYIVQDPVTGAGAYLISGGQNGGRLVECFRRLVPVLITILAIILIIALIYWLWPFIVAGLGGLLAPSPAYAAALIAFLAVFLSGAPAYAAGGLAKGGQADPCLCPPPPPPPPCEVDLVPPSRPHFPCPGDHWHYRVYNQGPPPACTNFLSGRLFGGCIPPPLPVPCPPC